MYDKWILKTFNFWMWKTNINWKHVIVGFNYESNRTVITLNPLISYVAYRIYKYKMYCRLQCLDVTKYNILHYVKSLIVLYAAILKNMKSAINCKLFKKLCTFNRILIDAHVNLLWMFLTLLCKLCKSNKWILKKPHPFQQKNFIYSTWISVSFKNVSHFINQFYPRVI